MHTETIQTLLRDKLEFAALLGPDDIAEQIVRIRKIENGVTVELVDGSSFDLLICNERRVTMDLYSEESAP